MRMPGRQLARAVRASLAVSAGICAADGAVVINEIMYNSVESTDVEFIEIHNTGPDPVDATNWYLLDDNLSHQRCYLTGIIPSGGYLVVPGFTDRFTAKYPSAACLNPNAFDGVTGWSLGNGGDQVRLYDSVGALIDFVAYSDQPPWPTTPDGTGPSLELYNPALDNSVGTNWGGSVTPPDGTPCAVNSVYRADQVPLISQVGRDIPLPGPADAVRVTARASDDKGLTAVQLFVDAGSGFLPRPMYDDGAHGDAFPLDGLFGADQVLPQPTGTRVRYYVSATDTLPQTATDPAAAPADWYAYTVGHAPPPVRINEIVVENVTGIVDENLQHEDWVELRNAGPVPQNLGGLFLTDDAALPRRWRIPDGTTLGPGARLFVWCDSDVGQGPLHAGFKLNRGGGAVTLFDTVDGGNTIVHQVTYGPTGPDIAWGYRPEDADAPEYLSTPTPGADNAGSALFSAVCINEFQTTSAAGGPDDWLELFNRGAADADISGWHVSDDIKNPLAYTFPPGTIIPAAGHVTVDQTALGFGWSADGSETIVLTAPDGLTGQDFFDYGPQRPDITQGRLPDGGSSWRFFASRTPGTTNVCSGGLLLDNVAGLAVAAAAGDPAVFEYAWLPVAGATLYDVVAGELGTLLASGGDFGAAATGCVENSSRDAASWDAARPGAGQGAFVLVRADTAECDRGGYGDGGEAAPRDPGLTSATAACP